MSFSEIAHRKATLRGWRTAWVRIPLLGTHRAPTEEDGQEVLEQEGSVGWTLTLGSGQGGGGRMPPACPAAPHPGDPGHVSTWP